MLVLGLSGKMGTGKSTLASLIVERVPGAVRVSFADALREEVAELLGIPVDATRAPFFKGSFFRIGNRLLTGREILQWWGGVRRAYKGYDYWVDAARRRLWQLRIEKAPLAVIDDVRFANEASMVLRSMTFSGPYRPGLLYRLDPYPGWRPGPNADHVSETQLDDWPDFTARFAPALGGLERLADEIVADDVMGGAP